MSNVYEFDLIIEPDDKHKRRELCDRIDIALMTSQIRIGAGTWRVTLERVPAKQTIKQDHQQVERAGCTAKGHTEP